MGPFDITTTPLDGLAVLKRLPIEDERGYFERIFCEADLKDLMRGRRVVQINHSFTRAKGTVRGMHFQYPPDAETKLVCCLRGEVWDVAVDVRKGSPTFLKWHAEILSPRGHQALFMPEGFAHGFQALSPDCALLYCHTAAYSRASEGGLHVRDPRLGIAWPMPVSDLSPRDAGHPLLTGDFRGIAV
jgi:dTDP-4-dehydrorhamnose 3,5-epimerase